MGYCVDMELRNVKFPTQYTEHVISALSQLNVKWHEKSDWCRYDTSLTDILEIIEDIGFECAIEDDYVHIKEFEREKLGDHQRMFKTLATYLEDCEIVYHGEDHSAWKQVIKDHEISVVEREEL